MSEITRIIGQRIRNYRSRRGWSQEKLAEMAGCHPTYIGQVERGEKNATMESIAKISSALGVSLSELFELIGGELPPEQNEARRCYELVASCSPAEQRALYDLLCAAIRYRSL